MRRGLLKFNLSACLVLVVQYEAYEGTKHMLRAAYEGTTHMLHAAYEGTTHHTHVPCRVSAISWLNIFVFAFHWKMTNIKQTLFDFSCQNCRRLHVVRIANITQHLVVTGILHHCYAFLNSWLDALFTCSFMLICFIIVLIIIILFAKCKNKYFFSSFYYKYCFCPVTACCNRANHWI